MSDRPQVELSYGLPEAIQILIRRKFLIVISIVAAAIGAWAIAVSKPPTYVATAVLVLNNRAIQIFEGDSVVAPLQPNTQAFRSEMDLLISRSLVEQVVDRLQLTAAPELIREPDYSPPWESWLKQWGEAVRNFAPVLRAVFTTTTVTRESRTEIRREEAVDRLLNGLSAANDGRSFTIHVSFRATNPEFAAWIVNAIAEEYLTQQVKAKIDTTREASLWLSQRLDELRAALEESEQKVEEYRQQEGLIQAGGEPLDEKRLDAAINALNAARQVRLQAETRLETMRRVLQGSGDMSGFTEVENAMTLNSLRKEEGEVRRKLAELSRRVHPGHPDLAALNGSLNEIQRQKQQELTRLARGFEAAAQEARMREQETERAVAALQSKYDLGQKSIRLRQLQREAQANRTIYESFLNRYKQTIEQANLQHPEGKLISKAQPPHVPNGRGVLPVVVIGMFGGTLVGGALAFARERLDRAVRYAQDIERATGLPVLGAVPELPDLRRSWSGSIADRSATKIGEAVRTTEIAARQVFYTDSTTALPPRIFAVTSALPNEGKTTYCVLLAHRLAADGRKVLLIDCDLRRARIGSILGITGGGDLISLIKGECFFEDALRVDPASGVHYLAARPGYSNPQSVIENPRFAQLLQALASLYDSVIIDTPPILSVMDAALVAKLSDACLFLIRWGSTSRNDAIDGLRRLHLCNAKVTGVIFSRMNKRKSRYYGTSKA